MFSNCSWIATESAAPPETATRNVAQGTEPVLLEPVLLPEAASGSSDQYIVGTPAKNVTFSLAIRASASAGSKRGIMTIVPPKAIALFCTTV